MDARKKGKCEKIKRKSEERVMEEKCLYVQKIKPRTNYWKKLSDKLC